MLFPHPSAPPSVNSSSFITPLLSIESIYFSGRLMPGALFMGFAILIAEGRAWTLVISMYLVNSPVSYLQQRFAKQIFVSLL